jgi:hypothetical protein
MKRKALTLWLLSVLLLAAVFLLSYFVVFFAISLTPYGHVAERVYSELHTTASNDPSFIGGAWQSQMLSPRPGAGSTNVSRDTAIFINEPRPVGVENLSLSPAVPCVIKSDDYLFSSYTVAYPTELLAPNTTYNVSVYGLLPQASLSVASLDLIISKIEWCG